MTDLLTNAQMRAVEAAAIAQGRVNGRVLMERAGECVVAFIIITWPDLLNDVGRAVVLCGPGNNGGDGYAVARLLRDRYWQVFVHGTAAGGGDAGDLARAWVEEGGQVLPLTSEALMASMQGATVVVDALLGIARACCAGAGFVSRSALGRGGCAYGAERRQRAADGGAGVQGRSDRNLSPRQAGPSSGAGAGNMRQIGRGEFADFQRRSRRPSAGGTRGGIGQGGGA